MKPRNEHSIGDSPSIATDLLMNVDSIAIIPDRIIKNVEAITNHQEQDRQSAATHHRVLEKIVGVFGQPLFLYLQIALFTLWEVYTQLVDRAVLPQKFSRFDLGEQGLDLASLFIATGVLIYQNRQEKFDREQSHLMLQLNLITEQKIAKLISLVEELRTDLPNVRNRHDLEAELMKQATDPQIILEVIQQSSSPPSTPIEDKTNETSSLSNL